MNSFKNFNLIFKTENINAEAALFIQNVLKDLSSSLEEG